MNKIQFDTKVLLFVVPLAVMLHLIGFGLTHGMKFNVYSAKIAFIENTHTPDTAPSTEYNEILKRDLELAEVFIDIPKEKTLVLSHEMNDVILENFADTELTTPLQEKQSLLIDLSDQEEPSMQLVKTLNAEAGLVIDQEVNTTAVTPTIKIGADEINSSLENPYENKVGFIGSKTVKSIEETLQNIIEAIPNGNSCSDDTNDPTSGCIVSSNNFDVDVAYAPNSNGGYFFRIAMTTKEGIAFRKIKRNVTFLVDKSHSISKNRYDYSRSALIKVLDDLKEEDSFNIVFFDNNIIRFKEVQVPCTKSNLQEAKYFIADQTYGGFFASTDLYASLQAIVPDSVKDDEVNIAILISDGDTYMDKNRQRLEIKKWTDYNNGKIALYSLASGKENNFQLLNFLSVINKGFLYTSDDNNDILLSIQKILNDIEAPIVKEITTTAVVKNASMALSLSTSKNRTPNLFEKQPLVLYGTANTLDDFYLFFQGNYYDKRINIKHLISLENARKMPQDELKKMWSLHQSYSLYERFLLDGQSKHLKEAKTLLNPFNIPSIF